MTSARLVIFVITYLLIAIQQIPGMRINRPAASLMGAVAMVAIGGLPASDAWASIDPNVIIFLLGVLLLTAYLELGGFFEWTASMVIRHVRSARALLAAVVAAAGLLSALFINDTICLVFTPILVMTLRSLELRPAPFLLALAFASNVGSAMTITGNPQNMLIGVSSGIGYASFLAAMALPSLGGLLIVYLVIAFFFRAELSAELRANERAPAALDRSLTIKALALFAAALVAWLAGYSLPGVAIAAGTVMVAISRRDAAEAFARVEWSLLLFFAALFVVMGGVRELPLFQDLTVRATTSLHGAPLHDAVAVSGVMTVLSNLVSNVPAVLLWLPVVPQVPNERLIWLVIAMSSTFAGNLTVLGSMANLIVAEGASARGVTLRFVDFLRVGVPVTLLTLAWGIAALLVVG
ncbi:MAG TPA: SLC13 family permease [Gemmatimonadaceae bacterium]|nr:SLC13 family permease [Gemmatimonadaceae bacterium]